MHRFTLRDVEQQVFDIAIIGGGVTGASAAREAALRGLSVVLVEKDDFAAGTSSRSTKLLHGGVRYLASHEFSLVREACRERELMLTLAPHLCHVRPFIYLLYRGDPEGMWLLNAGLTLYDLFSGSPLKRRHRMLGRARLLAQEPHLRSDGLLGGGWYYDFLTDDARVTIDTLKGAVEAGAVAANYMEVTGLVRSRGRVAGVEISDRITGETGSIRARQVINSAGPWVDRVRFLEQGVGERLLRPTKGVHVVVRKRDFPLNHAIFLRSPRDGRVVWPIPALDEDLVYIGTTDTDYDGPMDRVTATPEDVEYLLEAANFAIPDAHLGFEHVVATWAGLRPLVKPEGSMAASSVSREHQILTSPAGLLTIAGGKMTTARVMGLQVIERAVELLGANFGIRGVPASRSAKVPISGGDPGALFAARQRLSGLPLDPAVKSRWLERYGGNASRLADRAMGDAAAGRDLGAKQLTRAEVRYAVEEEMARTVTDFFTRRASVFYWALDGGLSVAGAVSAEMGRLLGWSSSEEEGQVESYREWVSANRMSPIGG
ncbi:MAG: glycerol-3-phosphate dehydrogenase/oxidase [Candidatus Dormibacteria bacterium]|jgi:glycerol-3-phosphate dehydrogenase|nr:glycerol-3-phosphate dehydrogenase [Chloroflexota bacterium]